MPLNIKDEATHAMARKLAARRGVTMAQAVRDALNDALSRQEAQSEVLERDISAIAARARKLPLLDPRPADDFLDYDAATGLPR